MLLQSFLRHQPPSSPLESSPTTSLSASPTMVGFISYESYKCCGFENRHSLSLAIGNALFSLIVHHDPKSLLVIPSNNFKTNPPTPWSGVYNPPGNSFSFSLSLYSYHFTSFFPFFFGGDVLEHSYEPSSDSEFVKHLKGIIEVSKKYVLQFKSLKPLRLPVNCCI
ncbi:hypothetical protein J1N35_007014 [Gossypium stocksii]|uniref:Uncharacterized protein n=1 Tax=Gossypium stocksii TaxID=47602 RepID=A0A9D3W5U6_9ROSI|nr:hypothetical protein J1N35_007014 [Gossypium stocksii]